MSQFHRSQYKLRLTVTNVTMIKEDKQIMLCQQAQPHAVYRIFVQEDSSISSLHFEIDRRWSDLKVMMEELERTEKRSWNASRSTCPPFPPHSFRLWGHTHPRYLAERKQVMQALVHFLVPHFCVSVIERSGPNAILEFLLPPAEVMAAALRRQADEEEKHRIVVARRKVLEEAKAKAEEEARAKATEKATAEGAMMAKQLQEAMMLQTMETMERLHSAFPGFLESNTSSLSSEELGRYCQQQNIVAQIVRARDQDDAESTVPGLIQQLTESGPLPPQFAGSLESMCAIS